MCGHAKSNREQKSPYGWMERRDQVFPEDRRDAIENGSQEREESTEQFFPARCPSHARVT
jgi:hypothetical protein